MKSVQRSIFFSAVERYASLVVFLLATAVLSRLLTPTEFGTYAVVNALTSVIAASFQEFGGANYLVQKRGLTAISVRTAFTITLGISLVIGMVLVALAGVLSTFFEQESLGSGIAVSALNFLLVPFYGTVSALLRREMNFGKLAICSLAGASAGAAISVLLALMNFSYMAPIWGGVAGNAVLTLMLLALHRNFGSFRPSIFEYRDVVGFGLYSSGVSVINVFYNLAPQLFMARVIDFAAVGLYSRAVSATQVFDRLVTQVLNPVIMPAIVARNKAGADLTRVYLDSIQLLSAVQWPFLIFIAIMARPIVVIWLGHSWLEIVPLVRVLCIANLALFAACLTYPVLVAVGRVRDALVASLISLPPSLVVIFCASFLGVKAVAASALLTLPFQAAVAMYFIGRDLAIGPAEFARALLKSGAVAGATASGVAGWAVLIEAGVVTSFVGLIAAGLTAALCWWLGLTLSGHPLLHRVHHAAADLALIVPRLRPWLPVL